MLSSEHRLRSSSEVQAVLQEGTPLFSPYCKVIYVKHPRRVYSRFAVIVGKKSAKKATDRNRIKRRLRAAIAISLPCISHTSDIIVLGKREILEVDFSTLVRHMYAMFYKI